jgi:hypothetical protein
VAGTQPTNPSLGFAQDLTPNAGDANDAVVSMRKGPFKNSSGSGDAHDVVLFAFNRPSDGALRFVIYDDSADALAVVT